MDNAQREGVLPGQETLTVIYGRDLAEIFSQTSTGVWFSDLKQVEILFALATKNLLARQTAIKKILREIEIEETKLSLLQMQIKNLESQNITDQEGDWLLKQTLALLQRLQRKHREANAQERIELKWQQAKEIEIGIRDILLEVSVLRDRKAEIIKEHPEILALSHEERQIKFAGEAKNQGLGRKWAAGMLRSCQSIDRDDAEMIVGLPASERAAVIAWGQQEFYRILGKDALASIIAEIARMPVEDQERLLEKAGGLLEQEDRGRNTDIVHPSG